MKGKISQIPPLTSLMDEGIQKEVSSEIKAWNERTQDRYPLSPSQIGKCSLKLARDVAHIHGLANYPRDNRTSRLHRIFRRGDTLELSLVEDFAKWTNMKMTMRQQRVHLFDVVAVDNPRSSFADPVVVPIEGNIDGVVIDPVTGTKILLDFKSKGAFYSAGFGDSMTEFFVDMVQTGHVESMGHNAYYIKDLVSLYHLLPDGDFFVDYLLQLNAYAFSDWFEKHPVDAVSLYYENKNTCENYEVRWIPDRRLFEYAKEKFQWIFETVFRDGPEAIPKEGNLGSSRCKLCEYNSKCWGDNPGKPDGRVNGKENDFPKLTEFYAKYKEGQNHERVTQKAEENIILIMEQNKLTHITMSDGMTYEKKYLKSPKPHYELRLVKGDKE